MEGHDAGVHAMTVFNLRGGNGSGKSTVHHWLLDNHETKPLYFANFHSKQQQLPRVWELPGKLFVIGRYGPGGDGIGFKPLAQMVESYAPGAHVFFENVMVSGNITTWLPCRQRLPEERWIWGTLDTPIETCLERIYNRNGGATIKEDGIIDHHNRSKKCHTKLVEAGEEAVWIDHTDSINHVHRLLTEAGWDCGTSH